MEAVDVEPIQARPYEGEESEGEAAVNNGAAMSRTSELTIAFEGEVFVFPAVTPDKGPFLHLVFL